MNESVKRDWCPAKRAAIAFPCCWCLRRNSSLYFLHF